MTARPAFDAPRRVRAAMVALGAIPALHALLSLAPAALWASGTLPARALWLVPAVLYLLPPIAVRLSLALHPMPAGQIAVTSAGFLVWWFTAQWQTIFVRLPALEELLRLLPGVYSMWLRLWGAQVGSLVYWAPGVTILDRPLIRIGSRVIFGMGVRINPHVLGPFPDGQVGLHLAPVTIGDDALIGGYSMLLPGSAVAAGSITRPFRTVHPGR